MSNIELRPEHPAARHVPVPQAAAAAVERGVDAAAHGVVDAVAPRARASPASGRRSRGSARRSRWWPTASPRARRPSATDRLVALLDHGDEARQRLDLPRGRHRGVAVRQRHVGDVACRAAAPRRSCAVVIASSRRSLPEGSRSIGMRARMRRSIAGRGDDDVAAGGHAPGRDEIGQQRRQVLDVLAPLLPRRGQAIDPLGEQVGQRRDVVAEHLPLLPRSDRRPARTRRDRS